jgi:flagellar assembly factor FliW
MSKEQAENRLTAEHPKMIQIQSSRFGELSVGEDTIISFPSGLIGFPRAKQFVMLEHKAPFSWLHSVEDPNLAFVVIDGYEFAEKIDLKPPYEDESCQFGRDDEFAILLVVTVRPDPKMTTVNIKAPLFVNVQNKKGVQTIIDDPAYSTRVPLWGEESPVNKKEDQSTDLSKPEK